MKTPVGILSLIALLGFLPAFAQQINLPDLQARVAKGEAEAELDLARAYHLGKGVPIDFAKAADLYRKSAEQGNAKAMYNLGYMQHHGQGMPEDDVKAEGWFQKAADKGLPAATLEVGLAYLHGDNGCHRDSRRAMGFTKTASRRSSGTPMRPKAAPPWPQATWAGCIRKALLFPRIMSRPTCG
jgi:TPR repeat protein